MKFRTFGIIGYGHFGQLMARSFSRHGRVLVSDVELVPAARFPKRVGPADFAEVAGCDVVTIAVPFSALAEVLERLRDVVPPDSVVMDVVSTKVLATGLLTSVLGEHPNLLSTHPLFGPPSMKRMHKGQRLVVTHSRGARTQDFTKFLRQAFGLRLHEMPPEDHDRAMAYMQALPFFIARALVDLDVLGLEHREVLSLPSFEKLATIAMIEEHHTDAMFETSQRSNPFAAAARKQLVEVLQKLDLEIDEGHMDFHAPVHADPLALQPDVNAP